MTYLMTGIRRSKDVWIQQPLGLDLQQSVLVLTVMINKIKCTLIMLKVSMNCFSIILGNNFAVNTSSVIIDILLKKHIAMSYQKVRKAIAAKIIKFYHMNKKENLQMF